MNNIYPIMELIVNNKHIKTCSQIPYSQFLITTCPYDPLSELDSCFLFIYYNTLSLSYSCAIQRY